jgi:hypothetical protein
MHALQVEHAEKTIILGPGNHTYNSKLHVRERKQIVGLYDTHWSNKTSDQKSVLICRGIQVYDSMSSVAVTFKNLTIKLEEQDKPQFCIYFTRAIANIINCEIECGVSIKEQCVVKLENCHVSHGTVSGVSARNSGVTIDNCRIDHNETGISLLSIGFEEPCVISNSTIVYNTRGVNASNVQAKFQLKNNVIENNKQFGVGTNSTRAALVQNKITNNHTGVFFVRNVVDFVGREYH